MSYIYSKIYKFKYLMKIFNKLITTQSEDNYELLEPWIQWLIHFFTGLKAKDHNIFRLGDGEKGILYYIL